MSIEVQKITRKIINKAFNQDWCPNCGKNTIMINIPTGMPGICCKKCNECKGNYQINYLEEDNDLLSCPKTFTFPKE